MELQNRYYENWAILIDNQGNEPPKLSPIYDTARGLLWNITESRLHRFSQRSASFKKCYPKMGWEGVPGKETDHFKLVKMIYKNEFYITKTEIKKLFDDSVIVKRQNRIAPIVNFPNKNQEYVSKYLWPFFTDRIPGKGQRQMMKETETSQVKLLQKYGRESIMNPFLVLFMVGMDILAINSLLKE